MTIFSKKLTRRLSQCLACPTCDSRLTWGDRVLACELGHSFPFWHGVPCFSRKSRQVARVKRDEIVMLGLVCGGLAGLKVLRDDFGLVPADVGGHLVLLVGIEGGGLAETLCSWGAEVVVASADDEAQVLHSMLVGYETALVIDSSSPLPLARGQFRFILHSGVGGVMSSLDSSLKEYLTPDGRLLTRRLGQNIPQLEAWRPVVGYLPCRLLLDWASWFIPRFLDGRWAWLGRRVAPRLPVVQTGLGVGADLRCTRHWLGRVGGRNSHGIDYSSWECDLLETEKREDKCDDLSR